MYTREGNQQYWFINFCVNETSEVLLTNNDATVVENERDEGQNYRQ